MAHSVSQLTSYLRSALQQDRRPLGIFLGAGTPMSVRVGAGPIIPDIHSLTDHARTLEGPAGETVRRAFIDLDGTGKSTVEHLLSYLRTLKDLPGTEEVRGLSKEAAARADAAVCEAIRDKLNVQLPTAHTPYHALAVWARAARRHAPIQFFTTNYDLLLEQALERAQVPYFDGFVGGYRPGFDLDAVEQDDLPTRWCRLWKIHGSINWRGRDDGMIVRSSPESSSGDTLIYPSNLKYSQSRRMPYLAMLDRLKFFLRQPSAVMTSVGFSFRDEHINEVIEQALQANPTASVQALMHGSIANYAEAILMADRTPNLTILAKDEAIVGMSRKQWSESGSGSADTFTLGDFAAFGDFLIDLSGSTNASGDTHE